MDILILITVVTVGIIALLNIMAFAYFHKGLILLAKKVIEQQLEIEKYIEENRNTIVEVVVNQHSKTRKDQQEIKTRLTQVRKDLNVIERKK